MSLGSLGTVLEKGLDDHVSWWCMNGIGERTRLRRFLVGTVFGARTRRPRLSVVYVRYWGTD